MSTEQLSTHEEVAPDAEAQASHEAEMVKVADELEANNNPDAEQRPDWLPEKFKDAEQMAEAYAHLEKKLGGDEPAEQAQPEEITQQAEASDVKEAVENAGVDFDSLQNEYNEQGGLTEASMAKLEEAGFSQDLVDSWIQGQEALANNYQSSVYESVGGEEAYGQMIDWAGDNLSQAEAAAFDRAVSSGDLDVVKLAVAGLRSQYQAAEGSAPTLVSESQSASSTGGVFNSWAEVTQAMSDARYQSDKAYRQQVSAKIGRSDLQQ
tara:strand:+ start:27 stop:821 length:795 start_codon:yes stop_codon:yes gene_type:complete